MKKIIAVLTFLSVTVITSAQSARDFLIYGGINYNTTSDGYGQSNTGLYLRPGLGYYINDKWTVGAFATWSVNINKDSSSATPDGSGTDLTVGPFVRYKEN